MAIFSSTARETPPTENASAQRPHTLSIIAKDLTVVGRPDHRRRRQDRGHGGGRHSRRHAGSHRAGGRGAAATSTPPKRSSAAGSRARCTPTDRVEVQATAAIQGDVLTRRIVVLEGGTVNGSVKMGAPPEPGFTE